MAKVSLTLSVLRDRLTAFSRRLSTPSDSRRLPQNPAGPHRSVRAPRRRAASPPRSGCHILLGTEENASTTYHSGTMTNETDEPQEQSWQPPSDYSQKSEGEPPANSAEQASAEIPPAVASRDGSGQYAGRASAFGTTGPGFAPQAFSLAPKPEIIPLRPLSVMEIISGAFDALGVAIFL